MGRPAIAAISGALVGGAGLLAYAVRARSSTLLAPSVHRGPRGRKCIALTFDDGPSPSTPELLDVLDRFGAKATFFECGVHVRRIPEVSREVIAAGHEIGNHTDTHPYLSFQPAASIREELARAQRSIEDATQSSPVWFRAPYGVRWFGLREAQREFSLTGVMWTVIARDWVLDGPRVTERLARGLENGAIFCLHDGRGIEEAPDIRSTLSAVRQIIPMALDQGYRFATVSELLCPQI